MTEREKIVKWLREMMQEMAENQQGGDGNLEAKYGAICLGFQLAKAIENGEYEQEEN